MLLPYQDRIPKVSGRYLGDWYPEIGPVLCPDQESGSAVGQDVYVESLSKLEVKQTTGLKRHSYKNY